MIDARPVIVSTNLVPVPLLLQTAPWNNISPVRDILSMHLPQVCICDAELIAHFIMTDSATFNTIPGLFAVRHLNLPKDAPGYPYLVYGLLAVSALHVRFEANQVSRATHSSLVDRARTLQQLALSSYISRLNAIDSDTCQFVFFFSVILAGLGFAFLSCPEEVERLDAVSYVDHVIAIFELLRGAAAVAEKSRTWIQEGRAGSNRAPLHASFDVQSNHRGLNAQQPLEDLRIGIEKALIAESEGPGGHSRNVMPSVISTMSALLDVFQHIGDKAPGNFRAVLGWPALLSRSDMGLLKGGHPAALVILAYYGVALHALNDAWWLRGAGSRLVRSVADILAIKSGQEWQVLLKWPLSRTEGLPQTSASEEAIRPSIDNLANSYTTPFELALRGSFTAKL